MPTEGTGTKKDSDFSERLRVALGDRSAYSLSKSLDVSTSTAEKWLKGISEPGLSNLCALARNLGVTIQWLAAGEGPMRPHMPPPPPPVSNVSNLDIKLLGRLTDGIVRLHKEVGHDLSIVTAVEQAVPLHDEIAAAIGAHDEGGRAGAMIFALSRLRNTLRSTAQGVSGT